ncbi:tRNA pseudouridine(38-40) synthase TruA [Streptobacillus moniliformis]|uniref:tRNA pseudouridine(38-40) synthase TruA n=1 Tax=Streptobacillus moniliformis TaxID=34105 RepID=UPI0007E456D2|nr:tRNA pseudouridine(38-40) synthase TruA [Streptobacillus moniliformis]
MNNIKIIYQYDGSAFYGSQRQKDKVTVQGTIEDILINSFNEKVNMISSGRTDRGVHAKMQVSNFIINKDIKLDIIKSKIEKYSNYAIKILSIEKVDIKYNSRFDCMERTYEFILSNRENITPFNRKYITSVNYEIDIEKLNDILKQFIGKHNFSNFSKKENKANKNPIREIYECYSIKKDKNIHIYIKGNSFLKSMVRIIIGTTLAIYSGKISKHFIKEAFDNPNPNTKKYILDGDGLYLYHVK